MDARRLKPLVDALVGSGAVGLIHAIKRLDRKRTANFAGALMRKVGPLFKEHHLGRENLRAAFPEKSDAEIEIILGGVWDNLGRVAGAGIIDHDHLHIVPRWTGDTNFMPVLGSTTVLPEALSEIAGQLRAALASATA